MRDPLNHRRAIIDLLTRHFDHTRGISDNSTADAEEITDVIMTAGWDFTPAERDTR
jgi:hypothetical protein